MIRVLLVDDEALVRDGIRAILDTEPDIGVVGEASDGHGALTLCAAHAPDVVLMDIRMPGLDGIETCRRLALQGVPSRVIMLTTFGLDEYVYGALRAGAVGFLLKDVRRGELAAALRRAAAGEHVIAPPVLQRLVEQYCKALPAVATPVLNKLTDREQQVLSLVAQGKVNAEIAAALYVSESTVKTHLARVLQKLGLRDRVQAVIWAYESGLIQAGS